MYHKQPRWGDCNKNGDASPSGRLHLCLHSSPTPTHSQSCHEGRTYAPHVELSWVDVEFGQVISLSPMEC